MNSTPIISLKQLRFSYDGGGADVLNDFSLDIPAGAVTAILGPNGAGKTTLLHLILGLLAPQAGEVWLQGQPKAAYSRAALSQLIGLVLQAEYIPFNFSVWEYVLLGRTPYLGMLSLPQKKDYQLALEAIERLGLLSLRDRSILELSGGERQMAMLARAIVQQSSILLLDEPTSHLDLSNKGRVLQILRSLAGEGVTVIFTTHEPDTAIDIAHHLVLMQAGRVLDSGPLREVLTSAKLSDTYGVPIRVTEVEGRPMVLLD